MSCRRHAFALLIVALSIPALIACGGGRTVVNTSPQTCGKELQDLQEARAKGALSDREYTRLRNATIERCRKTR
jgi:hypothetical protein